MKIVRKNDIKSNKYYSYKHLSNAFGESLYEEEFNSILYEADQQKAKDRQQIIDRAPEKTIKKDILYEKIFDLEPLKQITYTIKPNLFEKSLTVLGSDSSSITINWKYDIINWVVNEDILTFREVDRSTNEQYDRTFNISNSRVEGSRRVMLEERVQEFVDKSIDEPERGPIGLGSIPPGIQGGPVDYKVEVTLIGSSSTNVECGTLYNEEGATALGAVSVYNKNVPLPVTIGGDTVDANTLGTYNIIYTATNFIGKIDTAIRTVIVQDTIAPVVTLNGNSNININFNGTYNEEGATALDDCDGVLPVTVGGDTVDTSTYNTYTVEYLSTDSSGNTGIARRTINILDTIAPVVTLNGNSSINVECGILYNDEGATAVDDTDGSLPVTVGGDTVDANTLGTYVVGYSATDSSGNIGTNSRTVVVEDTIAPVITLIGSGYINVECSTSYNEQGATALDQCDGVLPVTVGGDTVDASTLGTYTILYIATDSSGNANSATRTVIVEDTIAPVVTLIGSSSINVECGTSYNDEGATALDDCDGVLSVTVGGDTVDASTLGTYVITYSATDSSGNIGTNSRIIVVEDTIAPVVTLIGSSSINVECSTPYNDEGATAVDACDGVLSVTVGGDTVDASVVGTYVITYSATDSSGNISSVSRTVIVEDTIAPVVTLIGSSSINVECGTSYNEEGATATDDCDGSLSVTIGGDTVDASVVGTYVVEYSATDSSGNIGTNSRTIEVVDTIAPVVTLIGSSSINVECSTSYNDEGATADDGCDGVLSVTVGGDTVDVNTLGTYNIIYTATDSSGNIGTNSRTVIVQDTIAPVVTLIGSSSINVEYNTSYTELGATALDDCDGSLSVTVGGDTVDANTLGTYNIIYTATDSSGNIGTNSRTVIVADTIAPVVTLIGSSSINVECSTSYNEEGATATDNTDGTLSVTVGGDTVDANTLGTYTVTYSATDSSGNIGTNSRTVIVQDTIAPVVTRNGVGFITHERGTPYNDEGATATDDCDGVLPVTVGGDTVDVNTLGFYNLTYSATDSSGNTSIGTARAVQVVDTIAPVVTLIGSSSVNVECSTSYNEEGATAVDSAEGSLSVTVGGDTVDVNTLGTYVVGYSATDSSFNTGTNSRTVIVQDTIAPVVTLNGSSTLNIDTDDTYTELGATALDACDGVISVTVGGDTVDVSVDDTYTVTYSATDSSGNTGTNSRTVVVTGNAQACGGSVSFSGGPGTRSYSINLGSSTGGTVVLNFNAIAIPDRFVVTHGGVDVIDTNYRGSFTASRVTAMNNALGAGNWTQGGNGSGSVGFVKTDSSSTATVTVYAPLNNTQWNFTLNCPV